MLGAQYRREMGGAMIFQAMICEPHKRPRLRIDIHRASCISGGVARVEQKFRVARNRICEKPNDLPGKFF
jgi:hypothetical protein